MPASKVGFFDVSKDGLSVHYTGGGELKRKNGKPTGVIKTISYHESDLATKALEADKLLKVCNYHYYARWYNNKQSSMKK